MTGTQARTRRIAFPILQREWGIVRRPLLGCAVLATLGAGLAFVTFDAENRYRIVADPTMLRSVLFPAGLAAGALCAWLSFVQEMRSGTWDGWLLLPAPRSRLLAAKLVVGIAGMIGALLVPSVALWLALHAIGDVGGPIIHFHELLFRSAFTLAAIIAVTTYLTTACAASMAREGHVAAFAAMFFPLATTARFFDSDSAYAHTGIYAITPVMEILAALVTSLMMVASLVLYVRRAGSPPRALESTLRAVLVLPTAVVALVLFSREGFDVVARALPDPRAATVGDDDTPDDDPRIGVDGTIAPHRQSRTVSTTGIVPLDRIDGITRRLRMPFTSTGQLQTFLEEDRHVLRAFDKESGREVGCVGANGLRADGVCRPFDGEPHADYLGDFHLLFTSSSVHVFHDDGRVLPIARGAVHGAATISLDGGITAQAVAIDDDVMVVRERPRADALGSSAPERGAGDAAEDDAEVDASPVLEAMVLCHDLVRPGQRVDHVVVEPGFVGAYVSSRAPNVFHDAGDMVVCRGGTVTQRVAYEDSWPPGAPKFWRGDFVAMAVGPAVERLQDALRNPDIRISDPPWFRPVASIASSVFCTVVFALALWWRRRVVAWWVFPGMILGPPYVLSCLALLWRRPRWASVVGGA